MNKCWIARITLTVTMTMLPVGVWADSVRLHDAAGTDQARVTLGDVAELEGEYAQSMRGVVVAAFREGATKTTVTLEAVHAALSREHANWGRLSLQGYNTCIVHRVCAEVTPTVSDASPVIANVQEEIGLGTAVTIRQMMIERVELLAGVDRADLRITFRPGDEDILNQSVFDGRVELAPTTSATLGRLTFNIRRYDGMRVTERGSVTVDVERRYLGLATTRTIKRGEVFADGDVEIRELWLDRTEPPLTDPKLVLGQKSAKLLRPDSIVTPDTVETPTLVRRNELIAVRCHSGGLVIRTVARAKEDGTLDQTIQAINEKTRETFVVTVVGRREGVVLLKPEMNP